MFPAPLNPEEAFKAQKEENMSIAGKIALSCAIVISIGALIVYEAPRLVKA